MCALVGINGSTEHPAPVLEDGKARMFVWVGRQDMPPGRLRAIGLQNKRKQVETRSGTKQWHNLQNVCMKRVETIRRQNTETEVTALRMVTEVYREEVPGGGSGNDLGVTLQADRKDPKEGTAATRARPPRANRKDHGTDPDRKRQDQSIDLIAKTLTGRCTIQDKYLRDKNKIQGKGLSRKPWPIDVDVRTP